MDMPDFSTQTPDLSVEDPLGAAALHAAAKAGQLDQLLPLLTPALLALRNDSSCTVLHTAAQFGHLAQILPLLTPELLSLTDNQDLTPVHCAAVTGGLALLLPLLTPELLGAKIKWKGRELAAIHYAAQCGHLAQVLPLLTPELLSLTDDRGDTPVHYAALKGFLTPILPLLTPDLLSIKDCLGETPVHVAAEHGHLAQLLPRLTPELLSLKTTGGITPVHVAAEYGHLDQLLPRLTAELLTLRNRVGFTPVHKAARYGHLGQILNLLTPDLLSLKDESGHTPLHYAARKPVSQLEALKPLLTRELCALEVNGVFVATRIVSTGQYAAISHLCPVERLTCSELRTWLPPVGPQEEFGTMEFINRKYRAHGLPETKYFRLASFFPSDSSPVLELPFAPGLTAKVSQGYDGIISHGWQTAIDFDLPIGAPICAAFDGMVTYTKVDGRPFTEETRKGDSFLESNGLTIRGQDGLMASYGHLDIRGVLVQPGEQVKAGQVIGYNGNTGVVKPHLHFETYRYDKANYTIMVPVPTWFRTAEGRTALQNGHSYTRPTPAPPKPIPFAEGDCLLPAEPESVSRLRKLLFHLPLVGQSVLRKWLSAEVKPGGVTRLHTLAAAGWLKPWLVDLIPAGLLTVPEEQWGVSPIHAAALFGQFSQWGGKLTFELLTHRTRKGNTAAHLAAMNGCLRQMSPLLAPGLLAQANNTGDTPVHYAAMCGHLDQIPHLLTPELLRQADDSGWTPVYYATFYGHLNQVLLWLTPELLRQPNKHGDTPVHLAAALGQLRKIAYLLTPELLASKNGRGKTPIQLATSTGQLEVIRHLLPRSVPARSAKRPY